MANQSIAGLISGLQRTNPELYQVLTQLEGRLLSVEEELFPLVRSVEAAQTGTVGLTPPAVFISSFTSQTVRFNWSEVTGALQYEVRKGTSWDTASFQFRVVSLQADIDPLTTGVHNYLIKSVDNVGNYSTDATACVVTVPEIGLVSLFNQVIDNNVLLSWSPPTSVFSIREYEVYKDAELLGTIVGTFFTTFEAVAGTYEFSVIAVDVAGNRSPESIVEITLNAPPDYELTDNRVLTFDGTKTNTIKEAPASLLAPCNTTESWSTHFSSRNWASIQAQIDAGFPIFIQPTANSGTYVEVIDYGLVLSNIIVTYNWQLEVLVNGATITISSRTSLDNVVWSSPIAGHSFFVTSMRYLELTITVVPTT